VFLVDDVFDAVVQYPLHTVVAEEEPTGLEAHRFSAGRRDQHAQASTANSDWWIKSVFNAPRAFDMCALWDHNLAGTTVRIECSDDDFTTTQTIFNAVIPSAPGAGDVDDQYGVLCENGMWLKRFPYRTAAAVRIFSVAMGAGLKPSINGKLGLSLALNQYDKPFTPSDTELIVREEMGESGWIGRGPRRVRRTGSIQVKTRGAFEYDQLRYHFEQRFGAGAPMVIVHDDSQAERAVMAIRRDTGAFGFRTPSVLEWPDELRVGDFAWCEVDPLEVR
jgi:hypothetical protein